MANVDTPAVPLASPADVNPLARLPIELLLRITRHLSTTDLCAVRLTSRTIERALFHSFCHEFFRRKQFMLSDFSLGALLAIAEHPELSRSLRHVSIGLEQFNAHVEHNFATPEQAIWVQGAAAQQQSLFSTGRGVELLAAAFARLPNLETVDVRDFESRTRFRDGRNAPWHSYGVQSVYERLQHQQGRNLLRVFPDDVFPSRAFALVVAALAKAGARPLRLEVLLRNRVMGLNGHAFDLTTAPGVDAAPLLAVLAGLHHLHLDVKFHRRRGHLGPSHIRPPSNRFDPAPASAAGLPLHAWLAHAPDLEWLRLNLQYAGARCAGALLDALGMPLPRSYPFFATSRAFTGASPDVMLSARLRRFDLGHTDVHPTALLRVLRRMPALESLHLWQVILVACETPNGSAADGAAGGFGATAPNWLAGAPSVVWSRFLLELAADALGARLQKVSLGSVSEEISPVSGRRAPVVWDGRPPRTPQEHRASPAEPMPAWLATLAASATVGYIMSQSPWSDNVPSETEDSNDENADADGGSNGGNDDGSGSDDDGAGDNAMAGDA